MTAQSLLSQVRHTIAARPLFQPNARVLVACSGGPDSTAMTHVLARLADTMPLTLEVASINHGMRPESVEEVTQVEQFAASLGLPFHPITLTLTDGASLQARARDARYDALSELAHAHHMHAIAVGHTQDDQAETVLSRLLHGAGLRGLRGILPCREHTHAVIVRPLIDASRLQVHRWLTEHALTYVQDPSNALQRFERVRIRTHLLPMLEEENPQLKAHLAHLADEAHALDEFTEQQAVQWMKTHSCLERRVLGARQALQEVPAPIRTAIFRRFLHMHSATNTAPQRAHIEACDHMIRQGRGLLLLPQNQQVTLNHQNCMVIENAQPR